MVVGEIDHLGIVKRPFRHDLRVPVRRPAFIHDLCLGLRREVIGFFTNDPQDIALPVFQRRALDQKQKDNPSEALPESAGVSGVRPRVFCFC